MGQLTILQLVSATFFLFLRWRVPAVDNSLSNAGLTGCLLFMMGSTFGSRIGLSTGPIILGSISVAGFVGAMTWQNKLGWTQNDNVIRPQASSFSSNKNDQGSMTPPRTPRSGTVGIEVAGSGGLWKNVRVDGVGTEIEKGIVDRAGNNIWDRVGINAAPPPFTESIPKRIDPSLETASNTAIGVKIDRFIADIASLEFKSLPASDDAGLRRAWEARNERFSREFRSEGLALRNEALNRLELPLTEELADQTDGLERGKLYGPRPIAVLSHAMAQLKDRLLRRR